MMNARKAALALLLRLVVQTRTACGGAPSQDDFASVRSRLKFSV